MEIAIIGFFMFVNMAVLKLKFEQERYGDLIVDVSALLVLSYAFGGSVTGMKVVMIASALMSAFLYIFPPKFNLDL